MISPRPETLVSTLASTLVAGLLSVGGVASSSAQTQTAQILGAEQITSGGINDTGALTVTVAGRSETVRFAGSSNAASVASGLAAAFALDCGSPVYAHATGSKIVWTPKGTTSGNFTVAPAQPVWDGGHFAQSSFQLNVTSTPGTGYTPSLSLDCTPNPVASGGSLSCTAELPAAATGTVNFSADAASAWSTKTISGGAAISDPLPGLGTGAHTITATYSGDNAFNKTTQSSSVRVLSGPLQAATVYSYNIALPAGGSGYAANGNILGYTDSVNGQWGLAYDALNRVANSNSQVAGQGKQYMCWTYDSFGNRTSESSSRNLFDPACNTSNPNYVTAFSFANNKIIGTNLPSLPQYDPNGGGNLIDDGSQQYLYDAENRICAVGKGIMAGVGQMMVGYIYDADGNRVAKGTISSWSCDATTNGFQVTSTYALDLQGQTVTENAYRNGASSWVHTDLFADGQLMATYDPNGLHFQIADWLGTRRVQTDALGQIEQTCQSLPFGNGLGCTPVAGAAQDATERHFTGKERDAETNNDYFGARYYASIMGRFMSPDWSTSADPVPYARMDNPQSLNLYAYVGNNPLSRRDGDGHSPCGGSANITINVNSNGTSSMSQTPDCSNNYFGFMFAGMIGGGVGHHYIPTTIRNGFNDLTQRLANNITSGPLADKTRNYYDGLHRAYNDRVRIIVQQYLQDTGKSMRELSTSDIKAIVQQIKNAGGETKEFIDRINADESPTLRNIDEALRKGLESVGEAVEVIEETVEACEGGAPCIPPL